MAAPLVDIGANLTNRRFQKDLPQVLRRAASAGVTTVLITGTSVRGSRDALALVARSPQHRHNTSSRSGNVTSDTSTKSASASRTAAHHAFDADVALFATVGVHPHDAKDFDDAQSLAEMRALIAAHPGRVVAVGECGLDFNRDYSPRAVQERVFRAQVALACELSLPLFLHERDAHDAFVAVLAPFAATQRLPPVVVHCFTGSERELRAYLAMGFYIGITGAVCMPARGRALRAMAATIPRDRLLIETDAPFMYPYAGGGAKTRCEPKDLRAVAQTLAECYGVSPDDIAAMTTANAQRFFRLDAQHALQVADQSKAMDERHSLPRRDAHPFAADELEVKSVAPVPAAALVSVSVSTPTPAAARTHLTVSAARADHTVTHYDTTTTSDTLSDTLSDSDDTIVLNGGDGEGGGQLLRVSVALAAVLGKRVSVHSVRANRSAPGLRNQHVQTLQLAHELARGGSELLGAQLGSSQITFAGALSHGVSETIDTNDAVDTSDSHGASNSATRHTAATATATNTRDEREVTARSATGGSVSLMIQGSLPILTFSARATTLRLSGGTHAGFSPPADFVAVPLQQLLARFGVATSLAIERRGFAVGQVGDVTFRVEPLVRGKALAAVDLSVASTAIARLYVRVTVFGARADAATGQQYERAVMAALHTQLGASLTSDTVEKSDVLVETTPTRAQSNRKSRGGKSRGRGAGTSSSASATAARERSTVSVLVVAETTTGGLLSVDRTGKSAPAAVAADVAQTLAQYIADGVCVDEHLADNAVVFMALAAGVSRLRVPARTARSSQHLETALAVAAQVAGATVLLNEGERSSVVEVRGIGWTA